MSDLVLIIKLDWEWDLVVLLGDFLKLKDLIEMRMECFRDFSVLLLALVLFAIGKDLSSGIVVELEELGV